MDVDSHLCTRMVTTFRSVYIIYLLQVFFHALPPFMKGESQKTLAFSVLVFSHCCLVPLFFPW